MNIIETNLDFSALSKRKGTARLILHHTATSSETVEQIHEYHKNQKKWAGIGYHFYVRKDGRIYRGRPEDTVGAHASGNNSDSIGICFEGNFQEETMPDAQKAAGVELVAYLKSKYGISTVQKHSDVVTTSCPGTNFPFEEICGGAVTAAPTPAPAQTPTQTKEVLAVDGRWGPAMTRRLQQIFGTTVDGKVSHQYACYKSDNPGLSAAAWEWEDKPSRGSQLITALQRYLNRNMNAGLEENGWIGPLTIKSIQAWMGTTQDGYFSQVSTCIKKLQEWANAQP